ncbi:hypothetical protein DENIS_0651 [Desulfonema ishimotonii]|uniref:Uncharacterized protein n=1 Tax=Desulfonema ishimotonii TaxID=45657 RepID=A0A401FRY7_9BACT|nr:hypothetical protein [Desulfonema ishimotonii]GBC59710.1 hypothetical protein DENIS_0651 [Desulfonema ishimotonii]
MDNRIDDILMNIGEEFRDRISDGSRFYVEVDIGKQAEKMGYPDLKDKYSRVNAVVPLKKPVHGMKVRIDGRTFVNYVQLGSGIAMPGYAAKEVKLPYRAYKPNDSMILNFA